MKQIELSQGKVSLVDDADFLWLSKKKWCILSGRGFHYATRKTSIDEDRGGIKVRMHREIMQAPDGMEVDHINHNGLDNRRVNLRLATKSQNMHNMKKPLRNTSGYKGVHWCKSRQKWIASITVNNKNMNLGGFFCLVKAAKKYDKSAIENFGEFANVNFKSERLYNEEN